MDVLDLRVAKAKRQSEAGYGRARMDEASRAQLGLEIGDVAEISGKNTIVAKVFKGENEDRGQQVIRIDGPTRAGAGIGVDDIVKVRRCGVSHADKVVLAPKTAASKSAIGQGMDTVFRSGLLGRPLLKGMDIHIPNIALMGNRTMFSVVSTSPSGPVEVVEDTQITIKEAPVAVMEERISGYVTYDDIGGLDDKLGRIREMIELPLKHPELFERMGISPPKGVLLYGPPGTGKTLIAEAVANESGAAIFSVRGPEIMSKFYGESEEKLRQIFKEAEKKAPSIVFLDELDSIAPDRDSSNGEATVRVVSQLLTLMDGMGGESGVIVIGATNREDSIDPALRRPGRFDREIEIGIPGRSGRKDILDVHTRDMPLGDDVDTEALAGMTQGFVGADLSALAREAAMKCLSRHLPSLDLDSPIPREALSTMKVTMGDFVDALAGIEPSGMREVAVDIPKVTWEDIGGLEDIRRELEEVFLPSEDGRPFERLGVKPGRSVLLYGPPGTGKTLIAKAVANSSGANFISIGGPEIVSKWMGETEAAIRKIFRKAKQMAPCIIFFDEIDSIAPRRGGGEAQAWERTVAQLLTAIDGVDSINNVMIMAATNRPDMLDPALMRPGRIDRMILVGKPDAAARLSILKVHTRRMPLKDVDLESLAEDTDGYVGADIAALCREAGLMAYRSDKSAEHVGLEHFKAAMETVKPSVTEEVFKSYSEMGKEMRKRRSGWNDVPFYG
ncbi:MAG: CDC48 family AAA ATPase [Candidatus Methanoplasma sp.]|jgi:transitional endoplasmic reticulum ATPase|nr:CDC48 family AAA ATPase [Candidatus Methanoplasma sp.]